MNIYLDIDGTMIHEDLAQPKAAAGLEDFIIALRTHTVYWLTTHCKDGNTDRAREIMKRYTPTDLHPDIDRILPTTWDTLKTQGIHWDEEFIWFDNDINDTEWERFTMADENQQVFEVNLRENPKQLIEITEDILR